MLRNKKPPSFRVEWYHSSGPGRVQSCPWSGTLRLRRAGMLLDCDHAASGVPHLEVVAGLAPLIIIIVLIRVALGGA